MYNTKNVCGAVVSFCEHNTRFHLPLNPKKQMKQELYMPQHMQESYDLSLRSASQLATVQTYRKQ